MSIDQDTRTGTAAQDSKTIRTLRRGIGMVGLLLPPAVTVGAYRSERGLPGSMSATYYTGARDVFVGGLCAIGVFLICYRPDMNRAPFWRTENFWSTMAGTAAVAVALFPTLPNQAEVVVTAADRRVGLIHGASAIVLFGVLAVFCLVFFPRVASDRPTDGKLWRNKVYRSCGLVILAAIVIALLSSALLPENVYAWANPLLWCEAAAVWAFAAAWFVKGETVLTDAQVSNLRSGRARRWSEAPAGG